MAGSRSEEQAVVAMSLLADSVSAIIAIRVKKRHDSLSDQYNRLLMAKMCILCSLVIGFNFFSDKVTCIISKDSEEHGDAYADFVGSACWIQGVAYFHLSIFFIASFSFWNFYSHFLFLSFFYMWMFLEILTLIRVFSLGNTILMVGQPKSTLSHSQYHFHRNA